MQDNSDIEKIQLYDRAVDRLNGLERDIQVRVRGAFSAGASAPTMRELAFLTGLRAERDGVLAEVQRLEIVLFDSLMAQASTQPDSTLTDPAK